MHVARPVVIDPIISRSEIPKRLEKKPSNNDLKRVSDTSPASKRSLPRPPMGDCASFVQPSIPSLRSMSFPPGAQPSALAPPVPSSTWPPVAASHNSLVVTDTQRKGGRPQHQSLVQNHHTTNSASSLPVVAGLADAGPYPSSSAAALRQPLSTNLAEVARGIGRTTQAGPSRPQNLGPDGAPQEEICLECMMPDRDLADIIVQGDGVWERGSDAAWDELRWREDTMLKSMGDGSVMSKSVPSLDHSTNSESEDNSTTSPPSTGHSLEDAAARQRMVMRRRGREARRARRREKDWRVITEVGWRGFRWEEGLSGAGLPVHFRGSGGGSLSEDGIKAIMTKVSQRSSQF